MRNALAYAYIGDSVCESHVREYLINKNIAKIKDLQHESLNYVSAVSQRRIYESLVNDNVLTVEEIEWVIYFCTIPCNSTRFSQFISFAVDSYQGLNL